MDQADTEVIAPAGQDVPLAGGRTIAVMPITVGQLPRFVKAIRPAFGALSALVPASSSPEGPEGQGAETDLDPVAVLDLYAEHGPALNEGICICTGMKPSEVDALNLEDAFKLLQALWSVNRDFFVQRVLPLLKR